MHLVLLIVCEAHRVKGFQNFFQSVILPDFAHELEEPEKTLLLSLFQLFCAYINNEMHISVIMVLFVVLEPSQQLYKFTCIISP